MQILQVNSGWRGYKVLQSPAWGCVCFVPCLLAAKTTWMWEAVLWSARAVVGQVTVSRVIPAALELLFPPSSYFLSLSLSPFSLSTFAFFFSFFFFLHQARVREERGWMLSFSLCQNSHTGLGFNLLLISLANPFPLLARISPGISKETM